MSSLDPTSSSTEMSGSQPTTNSDNPAMEEASPPPVYQAPSAPTWREYSDMARAISSVGSMHAMHADNQIAMGRALHQEIYTYLKTTYRPYTRSQKL
ncbi:hypothetical protein EW146_g2493 [Bondarzewia mesenterica]|uniref:Uncharacterized protein n=1 Tax=Bondarzewia mesenterica TaxID=1095465 RepID=A0A4S4M0H6_9AGAM|nr:hypothetical protein EW146_g2493 [Bondarzewia mesenterica]